MKSIFTTSELIRSGKLRPMQLVAECLDRIDRTEHQLHAWVHVDRTGAVKAAELLEQELHGAGPRGPLHGIPIGVKDIIDVAGLPTRAGSALRESPIAAEDAPVVARLRAAGAIVLGKTVTTQFACFDPAETVNPHDHARTPGGSSSGSAVAVATGTCMAALGSQTGGSIIRPASYCGVVGFKPTKGCWSTQGVVPVSTLLDHVGPITRCVEDLWPIWRAVIGSEADDNSQAHAFDTPLRFGVVGGFFREAADQRMLAIIDAAVARLVESGAVVEPVEVPVSVEEALVMHRRIMAVELAHYHRDVFTRHRDQYAPGIASLIEEGQQVSQSDYDLALKHRLDFIGEIERAFQRGVEFWLTPATTCPAPSRETTGDPAFNAPWSYCGFPALSIPCGKSDDGLPVSLQMVGHAGGDERLLQVAMNSGLASL